MMEETQVCELDESELAMVGGAGCRTEMRLRCDTSGECYAEAVLICDF